MTVGFRNITKCQIKAKISASDTTILLENTADYVPFISSPGDYVYAVLRDQQYKEIVKIDVSASSIYGLSVARGQENTSAKSWNRGTLFYQDLTAESLDVLRQKEVFRTFTYNPNGIVAPAYANEKIYQTGATACEKRWWKSINATHMVWLLIAGTICDNEIWYPPEEWDWPVPDDWEWPIIAYQVAMPLIIPPSGTYAVAQSVDISCATSGATIYYTVDGTTPDDGSTEYTGAISVTSTTTIKAIAYRVDTVTSNIATADIVIQAALPVFTPGGGTYSVMQSVTIACSTAGVTIYYTEDGSDPTEGSTQYTGAFNTSPTSTTVVLKARAYKAGIDPSEIATETYIFTAPTWDFIAIGTSTALGLLEDGTMWGCGQNGNDQLVQGTTTDELNFVQVSALTTWAYVVAGGGVCIYGIKNDGTLWVCGGNAYGQLGLGDTTPRTVLTQVGALTTWSKIAACGENAVAIKTDGSLWVWGHNEHSSLGLGDSNQRNSPVQLGALTNYAAVSAIREHNAIVLKTDGTIWGWGRNYYGELGTGDRNARTTPVQVGGGLSTWAKAISGLASGAGLAIKADGTLWAWGDNLNGSCGQGTSGAAYRWDYLSPTQIGSLTTWKDIAVGYNGACMATKTDGTLWAWGYNYDCQLGHGFSYPGSDIASLIQVGIATDWNYPIGGCFGRTMRVLKTDKSLYGAGKNQDGELGLGDTTRRNVPTLVQILGI